MKCTFYFILATKNNKCAKFHNSAWGCQGRAVVVYTRYLWQTSNRYNILCLIYCHSIHWCFYSKESSRNFEWVHCCQNKIIKINHNINTDGTYMSFITGYLNLHLQMSSLQTFVRWLLSLARCILYNVIRKQYSLSANLNQDKGSEWNDKSNDWVWFQCARTIQIQLRMQSDHPH